MATRWNSPEPSWPYGMPDPEPVAPRRRHWALWLFSMLLVLAVALTGLALAEATKPTPSVDQCAKV